ncbi:MAG: primosomal protein N' [Chloroflexi bacterium]|nr:primosomal protein N' [Chloroflexota bacterium]
MATDNDPSHDGPLPYAEIVVDARTTVPGDVFTYAAPPHLGLRPGHLVRVPFGSRSVHGVVLRLTGELRVDYVKPVRALVHAEPLLTAAQLALAEWIAGYYVAPAFDAIAPMLPPGYRGRSRPAVRLRPDAAEPERLPRGARRLAAYLRSRSRPVGVATLSARLGPWVPNAVRALVSAGMIEERAEEPEPRPARREVRVLRAGAEPSALLAFAEGLVRAPKQAALARRLAEPAAAPYLASAARREYGPGAVSALAAKGMAVVESAAPDAGPLPDPGETPLLPTGAQSDALAAINAAQDQGNAAQDESNGARRVFLLEGVTGSGKTEVYLQALAHCLGLGKRAIVLVPELSLTPQTVGRFEARFPGRVGLLHSGLTPAQHAEEWWRVRSGERGVVIGPRSAIFAPQPDLGLIVVDEEHEWTYKQTELSPRYHARDVALKRAELVGATVVLGSATPDLGTAYQAERGTFARLRLPERIERSGAVTALADVDVVDMRDELVAGNRSVFSRALQDALRETLAEGAQAMLFLNRRGSASIVECRACGHVMRCLRCSSAYTYHAATAGSAQGSSSREQLVCHHCNRRHSVPRVCPRCRSDRIRFLGLGTQRLVDEVEALLPGVRVLRWDRDAAKTVAAHAELLRRFVAKEADVLVGTQMIAKGLDIPSVALVGIVLADIGLHTPDFRAPERTFQLLTQVAGRAGRGPEPGRVVIQTYVPDHYAIEAAAAQDYARFYSQEIDYRRAQANPPLTRLVRLLFGHTDRDAARREAARMANVLGRVIREWDMHGVEVVGPAPTYPPRVRNAWRWHLLVRAPDPRLLLDKVKVPPGWTVDVDPVDVF